MSTEMGNDFGSLGEKLLAALFSQLLVNVKIMNLSAHVCLKRIMRVSTLRKYQIFNNILSNKTMA